MKIRGLLNKLGSVFLVLLMVFSMLFHSGNNVLAEAKVVDIDITKFEIQHTDGSTVNKIFITDTFMLMLEWDASKHGSNIHKDDYFDVTLPNEMWFPSSLTARNFDLIDENGNVIAKAEVIPGPNDLGGKVHVVFTDKVENKYNVKGKMHLAARFDRNQIKDEKEYNFTITVNGDVAGHSHSATDGVIITQPKPLTDETLNKWGGKVEGNPNQVEWHVRINHKKATLNDVVIQDKLSLDGESFIPDSFILRKVEMNAYGDISKVLDTVNLTGMITFSAGNKSFKLNLGNLNGDQYVFEYKSTYTPKSILKNEVSITAGNHNVTKIASYQSAESGGTGGGDLASKIKLIKVDKENKQIKLANAVFEVTKPDGSAFELTTGADGTVVSGILEQGTYKVKEKTAPLGYLPSDQEYTLQVTPTGGAIQEIENERIKINIEGEKTWEDNNNQDGKRPTEIKINLLKNGTVLVTKTVTEADGWKWKFENLDEYENGQKIDYTITEESVEGYTTDVNGYNVKNTHVPSKVDIQVTKEWLDNQNQDGKRPTMVTIQLFADGVKVDGKTLTLTEATQWSGSFTDLDEFKNGQKIVYTIKEMPVGNEYQSNVSGDAITGFKVTNSREPEKVVIEGTKTWEDNQNQDGKRPVEITINLLKNGTKVDSKKVTEADGWKWKFENLDKYENGVEIVYTITEERVEGYTTEVDGYNVKNSYTPGKVSIQVTKSWKDNQNQDGKRPGSVTIQLYADGVKVDGKTLTLTEATQWSGSFTDLDEFKNGVKIVYTIKEEPVGNGYISVVTGSVENGYTVTNTRAPEKTVVEGTKTWEDNQNQDGKRPVEITINLLKNGTKVDSKKVTEADGWKWKFENLDKYENGVEIVYTITEERVEGYTTEVDGYNVKNSYTPGKVSIQVTKSWQDNQNQDGKRPGSVTIQLYADDVKVDGKTLTLTEATQWSGSFTDLDEFKNGVKIVYTIKEEPVGNGYISVVSGDVNTGFVVTNTRKPNTPPSLPNTGYESNSTLLAGLVGLSGVALLLFGLFDKKNKQ